MQHNFVDGNHPWLSAFSIFAIIVPHVVTLILALLTYKSSVRNSQKISNVERTLNGKAGDQAELMRAIDKKGS